MAIAMIDGDINDQFNILWNYCNKIVQIYPKTFICMKLAPNDISTKLIRFQRFYVCIAACKVGFESSCKKTLGVDRC